MSEVFKYEYTNKNGRNNCKPKRRLTKEELQKLAINKEDGKKINTTIFNEFNKDTNKYEQTRERVSNFYNNRNMSDREIIEYLAEEIKQYRDKIKIITETMENKQTTNESIKAIYKAKIIEYENGKIDVLYECDANKNKECNKRYCMTDCCTHVLDKQYAKNYKD